ncbi:MAG: gfo/Idh/MocA family oxidoreductase, partial [Chitinophagaceae bacterium]|nr:gfo/Idh/MocA family oxidoreductase [Chitinophagaceae bacterium]
MSHHPFSRRQFIRNTSAALALASLETSGLGFLNTGTTKPRRVALIGTGWYGKSDLFRLIQVAPVEVVGLCDPD